MYFCQKIVGLLNPLKLAVLDSKNLKKLAKKELDKCLEEKKLKTYSPVGIIQVLIY